jgi:DNA-3-methyladenine glycosylase I
MENSITYTTYHDTEWGVPSYDDGYLFEMFVLESFHCGLSWLIILNKRDSFRQAFDQFDPHIIKNYSEDKINELMNNSGIVKNRAKIIATISNAKCFLEVQEEFGSFCTYIWSFTNNEVVYGNGIDIEPKNELSDRVAKDLKKRGFKFMGSVTAMSYLEALGIVNHHSIDCFKYVAQKD